MVAALDEEVRPLIGFSGAIAKMPAAIAEAMNSLKDQASGLDRSALKDAMVCAEKEKSELLRQQVAASERDAQQAAFAGASERLQAAADRGDRLAESLAASERRLAEAAEEREAMEAANEALAAERDRLERLIAERAAVYERRLADAVAQSKAFAEDENEMERRKHLTELAQLAQDLERANKKLGEERKLLVATTQLYNELGARLAVFPSLRCLSYTGRPSSSRCLSSWGSLCSGRGVAPRGVHRDGAPLTVAAGRSRARRALLGAADAARAADVGPRARAGGAARDRGRARARGHPRPQGQLDAAPRP
jgi:hypothetical protein